MTTFFAGLVAGITVFIVSMLVPKQTPPHHAHYALGSIILGVVAMTLVWGVGLGMWIFG